METEQNKRASTRLMTLDEAMNVLRSGSWHEAVDSRYDDSPVSWEQLFEATDVVLATIKILQKDLAAANEELMEYRLREAVEDEYQ